MAKEWAKALYNSKQWQVVRQAVLRRDHYTCAHCYGRAEEIHHVVELTPDNIGSINISLNPDNLIALCHTCHTKITQGSTGDVAECYCFDEEGHVIRT